MLYPTAKAHSGPSQASKMHCIKSARMRVFIDLNPQGYNQKCKLFCTNSFVLVRSSAKLIYNEQLTLKETRNSFKKWPFDLWWISNKTIMEVENVTKAATFISFLHLNYKNIQLLFFVTVLFNIFMGQTLTDDFWGLNKNMNCAFPLKSSIQWYHVTECDVI